MIEFLFFIMVLAIILEIIDAGLGMGYGTALTPILLGLGIPILTIVPCVLISQAVGGFIASLYHNKLNNAKLRPINKKLTTDLKISLLIAGLGVIATIFAVVVAISIPVFWMKLYIGVLVLLMGALMLIGFSFKFSWKNIIFVGLLSSFNKGLSGGGFGPVVTGGQIISGQNHKNAIGCTTFAEAPICIAGFATYAMFNGFPEFWIMIPLIVGAGIGAPIGAMLTNKIPQKYLKELVGVFIVMLGLWTLIKLFW